MFNIFTDYSDSVSIVHGFIEEITVKLNDTWMVLCLEELYGFFLVFVEFVKSFGFHFLEGIELAGVSMYNLINLSILLA